VELATDNLNANKGQFKPPPSDTSKWLHLSQHTLESSQYKKATCL